MFSAGGLGLLLPQEAAASAAALQPAAEEQAGEWARAIASQRSSVSLAAGEIEKTVFPHTCVSKRPFYQDRLGINIGKAQKKIRFFAAPRRSGAGLAGCGGKDLFCTALH